MQRDAAAHTPSFIRERKWDFQTDRKSVRSPAGRQSLRKIVFRPNHRQYVAQSVLVQLHAFVCGIGDAMFDDASAHAQMFYLWARCDGDSVVLVVHFALNT
jgi:hypothetical protein